MPAMRLVKHIPNALTCCNLLSGAISILFISQGRYDLPLLLMGIGAAFDFLDGFAARLLKAYSPVGKELDSLADLISFGLVPALLLQQRYTGVVAAHQLPPVLGWFPLLLAAFSAVRLAKFNLDERQTENFIGLPTPAAALFVATGLYYSECIASVNGWMATLLGHPLFIPVLTLVLCYLLLCELPMFSLKVKSLRWKDNQIRYTFLVLIGLALMVWIVSQEPLAGWLPFVLATYLILNLIQALLLKLSKKKINNHEN